MNTEPTPKKKNTLLAKMRSVVMGIFILTVALAGALTIDLVRQSLKSDQVQWEPYLAHTINPVVAPVSAKPIAATKPTAPEQAESAEARPMLVFFTADWCGACKMMKSRVFSRTDVAEEIHKRFDAYHLDLTDPSIEVQVLAQRHGVLFLPTLLITDANGKELARLEQATEPDEFLEWLEGGENRWLESQKKPAG
ncbi:MAG: thioredoxin fold domain-containing protein [Planctomycetota bacterium]